MKNLFMIGVNTQSLAGGYLRSKYQQGLLRLKPIYRIKFIGLILCYGFGDNGSGYSDSVLLGKLAWDYAIK